MKIPWFWWLTLAIQSGVIVWAAVDGKLLVAWLLLAAVVLSRVGQLLLFGVLG